MAKHKLQEAMANMQEDWHEYLSESLLFKSRKQLAAELVPEVMTVVKSKFKEVQSWGTVCARPIVLA